MGQTERERIWDRDRGRCFFCRKPVDPAAHTLHMLIPQGLGGIYRSYNLRVAHPRCPDRYQERAAQLAMDLVEDEFEMPGWRTE